jgi:hypothetical protein
MEVRGQLRTPGDPVLHKGAETKCRACMKQLIVHVRRQLPKLLPANIRPVPTDTNNLVSGVLSSTKMVMTATMVVELMPLSVQM